MTLAEALIAIGGIATALATAALAVIAWSQLSALRKQLDDQARQLKIVGDREKQWRTIEACERYSYDPVLRECKKRLWEARRNGALPRFPDVSVIRQDAILIVNYLDAIGTGVAQGVYLFEIVRDHLRVIVMETVERFVQNGQGEFGINKANITGLMTLHEKITASQTNYKAAI